jgi:hypothetical protein
MAENIANPRAAPSWKEALIKEAARPALSGGTPAGVDCTMSHLAMLEGTDDGDGTTWLEPVTDEQYAAANPASPAASA